MQTLRVRDVAKRLSCSPVTVRRLAKKGEFPPGIKIGPNIRIWRESDVDAYLARQHEIANQKKEVA